MNKMDKLTDFTKEKPASRSGSGDSAGFEEELLVVVTGGSKGIGRSCVECFARRGAHVLFSFCSDTEAAAAVERSVKPTGRVQGRRLDQGDFDSVQAFAVEVERWRAGREVDVLVNNAGLGTATVSSYPGLPRRTVSSPGEQDGGHGGEGDVTVLECARRRADEDMALMRVNALGPMWVTEALLPMMGRRDASSSPRKQTVLFVGSVGGGSQSVFPGFRPADAMSKAAVAYACKHFAARRRRPALTPMASGNSDVGESTSTCDIAGATGATSPAASDIGGCVDFICLCPGATLTDMFRASTLDKLNGPEQLESFMRALPQGRLTLPQEVGEVICWLCTSPAATMFHGAVIDASAGLAVRPGVFTEYAF